MTNEITKQLMAICIRNGVVLWIEKEKADTLFGVLEKNPAGAHRFIQFHGEMLNTADIVGIFEAKTMSELTRRQNGKWACDYGSWHEKRERCECVDKEVERMAKLKEDAIKKCGKCKNGIVVDSKTNVAGPCPCLKDLW